MAYRRTDRVLRRLAARHDEILRAARAIAAEQGMAAVQIVPVAERAGIAAGTVYRYFPAKLDLVAALIASVRDRSLAVVARAARKAPGPLSALAAAIGVLALQLAREPRLAFAVMAEPVDADIGALQAACRRAVAAEIRAHIGRAMNGQRLPEQDGDVAAVALVGAMVEALAAQRKTSAPASAPSASEQAQVLTLLALRALGMVDAQARGLIVQSQWPERGDAA